MMSRLVLYGEVTIWVMSLAEIMSLLSAYIGGGNGAIYKLYKVGERIAP